MLRQSEKVKKLKNERKKRKTGEGGKSNRARVKCYEKVQGIKQLKVRDTWHGQKIKKKTMQKQVERHGRARENCKK